MSDLELTCVLAAAVRIAKPGLATSVVLAEAVELLLAVKERVPRGGFRNDS